MNSVKTIYLMSIMVMALTIIHHFYGAFIYDQAFRLHVAIVAVPVIVFLWLLYRNLKRHSGTIGYRNYFLVFMTISLVLPVLGIGLFEGGYNHLLKNILYFGGLDDSRFRELYPAPTYEEPNDFVFEGSGVLQLVLGLLLSIHWVKGIGEMRTKG